MPQLIDFTNLTEDQLALAGNARQVANAQIEFEAISVFLQSLQKQLYGLIDSAQSDIDGGVVPVGVTAYRTKQDASYHRSQMSTKLTTEVEEAAKAAAQTMRGIEPEQTQIMFDFLFTAFYALENINVDGSDLAVTIASINDRFGRPVFRKL